jgi:hypothetical protein
MSHRHKKPFQPSITSYFARADRQNGLSAPPTLSTPALEEHIQVSLAQVGMRIRKAVPEGYKTQKAVSTYTPASAPITTMTISSRPSELLPFCGLHKIGGLSVQPMPAVSAYEPINVFSDTSNPLADFGTPFASQESAISTGSVTIPAAAPLRQISSNKRSHSSDEEEQDPDYPDFDQFIFIFPDTAPSATRSRYPISHTIMPDLTAISSSRAYAKPKSRRKGSNIVTQDFSGSDMDFDDASFLTPLDGDEVEMGGI